MGTSHEVYGLRLRCNKNGSIVIVEFRRSQLDIKHNSHLLQMGFGSSEKDTPP